VHSHHPMQPFWNLAAAPMQTEALRQAVRLRLFEHLAQPADAAAIAQRLSLHPATTAIWLDVLWSMGLLHRHAFEQDEGAAEYVVSDVAARFFSGTSPHNCAPSWQFRAEFLAGFAEQWERLLRDGILPPDAEHSALQTQRWAQAAREHLGQEQRVVSAAELVALLRRLPPLLESGRFADVGGGPGHVAIALAQHLPGWRGVVLEQADTAAVAAQTIHAAGLSARLSARACDLNTDAMDGGYDLIWCSSVLHFLRDPQAAVRTMGAALNPGGLALLAHAELSDDPQQAAEVMPFYAGVMLRGGRLPHAGKVARWMCCAGLADVRALGRIAFPLAPLWVYAGRRP